MGALIGAGVEAVIQIGTTGKVSDWKAVSVAGAANGVGTVASNAIDGKATTATEAAVAVAGGAAGAGAGAKIANQVASKLGNL